VIKLRFQSIVLQTINVAHYKHNVSTSI